jgi:hypothetical protein
MPGAACLSIDFSKTQKNSGGLFRGFFEGLGKVVGKFFISGRLRLCDLCEILWFVCGKVKAGKARGRPGKARKKPGEN